MKIKFLLNSAAGKCKGEKLWLKAKEFFDKRKIAYDLEKTIAPNQATELAKRAVESGFDTIVSIGGDGFANEVANGMIGSEATLGLLPCGKANDFSKMLDVPANNIEEACRTIISGFSKKIDVGMINGRYFLNVVGIGIDGEITEAKTNVKKYLPAFLGYFLQSLSALLTYKPKKVNIRFNGNALDIIALSLNIGNGKCTGGGFLFVPEARIDDGILNICLIRFTSRLRAIWDFPKLPKAKHVRLPYVSMHKAKEITVASDELLTCHIDGEVAKARRFEIKILPQTLKVLTKMP
jgi:YegS/Rv2252/BmrU family lipid kinase